jgi:hypothetical protein
MGRLFGLIEHTKGFRLRNRREGGQEQGEKGEEKGRHDVFYLGMDDAFVNHIGLDLPIIGSAT